MSTGLLEEIIQERNRERRTDAWIQLTFGVIATVVVSVCIFAGCAFAAGTFLGGAGGVAVGLLATVIFLASATWSAWHKIDPLQGITVEDFRPDGPWLERGVRGRTAALAAGVISGPGRLLEGWRSLRFVIPYDQDTLAEVSALLGRCQGEGLAADRVAHDRAFAVARMLRLTKDVPGADGVARLRLTDKGRAVMLP